MLKSKLGKILKFTIVQILKYLFGQTSEIFSTWMWQVSGWMREEMKYLSMAAVWKGYLHVWQIWHWTLTAVFYLPPVCFKALQSFLALAYFLCQNHLWHSQINRVGGLPCNLHHLVNFTSTPMSLAASSNLYEQAGACLFQCFVFFLQYNLLNRKTIQSKHLLFIFLLHLACFSLIY